MSEEKQDKIIRLLNQINEKVELLNRRVKNIEDKLDSGEVMSDTPAAAVSPSDVVWQEKQAEKDIQAGGRLKCPQCGAVGNDIATQEDKENVITYIGGVPQYGKKYYCKKCMEKWTQ